MLMDRNGVCIYSDQESLEGCELGKDLYYQDYSKMKECVFFVRDPVLKDKYSLFAVAPVSDSDGEFAGCLMVRMNSDAFLRSIRNNNRAEFIMIVNRRGLVVLSSDPDMTGCSVEDVRQYQIEYRKNPGTRLISRYPEGPRRNLAFVHRGFHFGMNSWTLVLGYKPVLSGWSRLLASLAVYGICMVVLFL